MKRFFKVFGATSLALLLMVTLTGCSSKPKVAGPNELVVWGFVDEDVMKPIIKDFAGANKSANVKYYKKTLDSNYENDSLNSILSGQGPDVWAIPNDWVYRHKDKLAPMPPALLNNKKIVAKDYFAEVVIQDNVFDNNIYGLTPTVDVLQAYFNPNIFDEARRSIGKNMGSTQSQQDLQMQLSQILNKFPITWDELNKVVPYLTVRNGNNITRSGVAMGTSNNVTFSHDILSALMLQNQTKMTSDDLSQATFNLPIKSTSDTDIYSGKKALDFYASYSNPSSPNYSWNSTMPNEVEAFAQGKVAIIFGYSNLGGYLKQIYPNFQFQQALFPQIGEANSLVDYAQYTSFAVPENSLNTSAAWQFISFLSTEGANSYRSATKEIASKKILTETSLKNRGATIPGQDQLKSSKSWNKGRYPVETDDQFKQAISRFADRSQDSQASLDTAAANITSLLRKETW